MMIVKSDGQRVAFKPEKIGETLRRIGAKPELVAHVTERVAKAIKTDMSTREVYQMVRRELRKENRCIAHRYNLRSGLLKLGPAGFRFEKYVASILRSYRYEADTPKDNLRGLCVDHEIDVVAKAKGRTMMIEAKFRQRFDDTVNLKDAMSTWARLIDLRDGASQHKATPKFDEAWIVTNGRFSEAALQFGTCKGMQMIGWTRGEQSLARMVDHAVLYPITVIEGLKEWELEKFSKKNLMLCTEVADKKPGPLALATGLPLARVQSIVDSCKEVVAEQ